MKKLINKKLSALSFEVTQNSSTEPAFSGEYYTNKREGLYKCICCDENLFHSNDKYDSGSGWPSFTKVIDENKVRLQAKIEGTKRIFAIIQDAANEYKSSVSTYSEAGTTENLSHQPFRPAVSVGLNQEL